MDRRVHVTLLAVVVAVVALAGPVAAANGDDARSSIGSTTAAAAAAASGEAVVHRRVLARNIEDSALNPNRPACTGSCPAAGGSYTGRGCAKAYGCKN